MVALIGRLRGCVLWQLRLCLWRVESSLYASFDYDNDLVEIGPFDASPHHSHSSNFQKLRLPTERSGSATVFIQLLSSVLLPWPLPCARQTSDGPFCTPNSLPRQTNVMIMQRAFIRGRSRRHAWKANAADAAQVARSGSEAEAADILNTIRSPFNFWLLRRWAHGKSHANWINWPAKWESKAGSLMSQIINSTAACEEPRVHILTWTRVIEHWYYCQPTELSMGILHTDIRYWCFDPCNVKSIRKVFEVASPQRSKKALTLMLRRYNRKRNFTRGRYRDGTPKIIKDRSGMSEGFKFSGKRRGRGATHRRGAHIHKAFHPAYLSAEIVQTRQNSAFTYQIGFLGSN